MAPTRRALLLGGFTGGLGGSLLWLSADRPNRKPQMPPEVLLIDTQQFPIEYASLSASIVPDQPTEWSLFLRASPTPARLPAELDQRVEPYSPTLTLERFRSDVRSLDGLARARFEVLDGKVFSGGRLFPGEPCCVLYVKYHDSLKNSRVEFHGYHAGRLSVTWTADSDYGPVRANAAVTFEGLWVAGEKEDDATALFRQRFQSHGFRPTRGRTGWWFEPA